MKNQFLLYAYKTQLYGMYMNYHDVNNVNRN